MARFFSISPQINSTDMLSPIELPDCAPLSKNVEKMRSNLLRPVYHVRHCVTTLSRFNPGSFASLSKAIQSRLRLFHGAGSPRVAKKTWPLARRYEFFWAFRTPLATNRSRPSDNGLTCAAYP